MANHTYKILCADGRSVREIEACRVTVEALPNYEFIAYRESGQAYWIVSEVSSGARVSLPRQLQSQAIASANERIRAVGIEQTKTLIAERATKFSAILEAQSA